MSTQELLLKISLIVVVIAVIVLVIQNLKLNSKNELYRAFVKKVSVKQFIALLNNTSKTVVDTEEVSFMIGKYFEMALINLNSKTIPKLLNDIKESKHYIVLTNSLKQASFIDNMVFGMALGKNYLSNPLEKEVIELFLNTLPAGNKKEQYQSALNILNEEYESKWIDLPYEHKQPIKDAISEVENVIKGL